MSVGNWNTKPPKYRFVDGKNKAKRLKATNYAFTKLKEQLQRKKKWKFDRASKLIPDILKIINCLIIFYNTFVPF